VCKAAETCPEEIMNRQGIIKKISFHAALFSNGTVTDLTGFVNPADRMDSA
jgi:hypothetical protein